MNFNCSLVDFEKAKLVGGGYFQYKSNDPFCYDYPREATLVSYGGTQVKIKCRQKFAADPFNVSLPCIWAAAAEYRFLQSVGLYTFWIKFEIVR